VEVACVELDAALPLALLPVLVLVLPCVVAAPLPAVSW
jgi:hypothetical protein